MYTGSLYTEEKRHTHFNQEVKVPCKIDLCLSNCQHVKITAMNLLSFKFNRVLTHIKNNF